MNSRNAESLVLNSTNKLSKNEINHITINNSTNQGSVAVVESNKDGDLASQHGKESSVVRDNKGSTRNVEALPQTGETIATITIGLGIVLIAISGVVVFNKKN